MKTNDIDNVVQETHFRVESDNAQTAKKSAAERCIQSLRSNCAYEARTWVWIAKDLLEIDKEKHWQTSGYHDFMAFCDEEIPDHHFSTISRYKTVYEAYGDEIEKRIYADPNYVVPSYDALHRVLIDENVSAKERAQLERGLLDGNLRRKDAIDALEAAEKRKDADVNAEIDAEQIKQDAEAASITDDGMDIIVVKDAMTATQTSLISYISRVEFLLDNMPILFDQEGPALIKLPEMKKLCSLLRDLRPTLSNYTMLNVREKLKSETENS